MLFFKKKLTDPQKSKLFGGILGVCVGDALGFPYEFKTREEMKATPCKDMIGIGAPAGMWSDDTSMTLCTIESLINGYDIEDMGQKFCNWLFEGFWTPYGIVFDVGYTTQQALINIKKHNLSAKESGFTDEQSNGNGSLMRILPLAYFLKNYKGDKFKIIEEVSAITHAHIVSKIACSIYIEIAINLLNGDTLIDAYNKMKPIIIDYYEKKGFKNELEKFNRILREDISKEKEDNIKASGYVLHTLEASLWALLNSNSYKSAVLKAINLGEDTDTVGAITGGLAGIYYGIEAIPKKWLNTITKKDNIIKLIEDFYNSISI